VCLFQRIDTHGSVGRKKQQPREFPAAAVAPLGPSNVVHRENLRFLFGKLRLQLTLNLKTSEIIFYLFVAAVFFVQREEDKFRKTPNEDERWPKSANLAPPALVSNVTR
jgi:hypothetical protein